MESTRISLVFILALTSLWGCGESPQEQSPHTSEKKPLAVRPRYERPKSLPEKTGARAPEDGAYRFFDPERRPVAKHVAYLLLKIVGFKSVSYSHVRLNLQAGLQGASLGHLKVFFDSLGLEAVGVEESLQKFLLRDKPGILTLKPRLPTKRPDACRLVLFRGLTRKGELLITDPLQGALTCTEAKVEKAFAGAALFLKGDLKQPLLDTPDIGLDEVLYSYGRVDSGTVIRHTFRVFNRGGKALKIHGIRPSCGCLATPIHEKKDDPIANPKGVIKRNPENGALEVDFGKMKTDAMIKPGGEVFITGFYDSTNRYGFKPASFTLFTNDPDESEVTLFVEGQVDQVAYFDPPVIHWEKVNSALGAEAFMWVRSRNGKAFTIRNIMVRDPDLIVEPAPDAPREKPAPEDVPGGAKANAHPESEGWKALKVWLKPGRKVGMFHIPVALDTDLSPGPLAFGVWGRISGNIEVIPSVAAFGQVKLGRQAFAHFQVFSRSKGPFRITRASVTGSSIMDLSMDEVRPGVFKINLALKKGWLAPSLKGEVVLHTNDPIEPVKVVDVTGYVKRG